MWLGAVVSTVNCWEDGAWSPSELINFADFWALSDLWERVKCAVQWVAREDHWITPLYRHMQIWEYCSNYLTSTAGVCIFQVYLSIFILMASVLGCLSESLSLPALCILWNSAYIMALSYAIFKSNWTSRAPCYQSHPHQTSCKRQVGLGFCGFLCVILWRPCFDIFPSTSCMWGEFVSNYNLFRVCR